MGQPRIFQDISLAVGATIELSESASHHLCQVLRAKQSASVIVFNGQGGEYQAEVVTCDRRQSKVQLVDFINKQTESLCKIHLAQAISKGDRMDYAIQKAVELGVHAITPIFTERTEVRLSKERLSKKLAHWQAVALAATEQSGRCCLIEIKPPMNIAAWLSLNCHVGIIFDVTAQSPLSDIKEPQLASVNVMIGPEGGFSQNEVSAAKQAGYIDICMGPRILRTETATVVALSLLQFRWGDFY